MRLLHYNWVDYLDDEGRGGGVSVYQRNLIAALGAREGIEAGFVSSGVSYDLRNGAPRWEQARHGPAEDRERRWEIVNSGVLAPAHHAFGDPAQVDHPATVAAFCDFVAATGPWDVVQFNNLEGIPARVLEALKARFPDMRIVLMLHNYYPVCPQVNLWQRETAHCTDFRDGHACVGCLLHQPGGRLIRKANGVAYRLKVAGIRPGTRAFDLMFLGAMRAGRYGLRAARAARRLRLRPARRAPAVAGALPPLAARQAETFARRRADMVALINAHADRVLAVSDRVGEIAVDYGIDRSRVATSYIGTREAAAFARTAPRGPLPRPDGTLRLAYLGYMRADKGFLFLLDALEALPDEIAGRLHLLVAARSGPPAVMARLEALRPWLASLDLVDGYTHAGLDELLGDVDAGLVPVLWEDNLPQVAIEMHARHIPLLTSDRGGARELGRCPGMTFAAGDTESFRAALERILGGEIDMEAYWQGAMTPVGMEAHVDDLLAHYAAA